jgi:uncharacterized protein (DUF427 family)
VHTEPGRKRVRAGIGGVIVLDTITPTLVWEVPYYPAYYVPRAALTAELRATGALRHSPSRGDAAVYDLVVGDRIVRDAAYGYDDSPIPELNGLIRLEWQAADQWFEEDEEIFVHPRDPHTRVDVLASSRHVQIAVDGVVVADSHQPRILFETGLPPRYYLPKTDVRMDLLTPSDSHTSCPYKGTASYYDVHVNGVTHADLVWWYPTTLPESQKIVGLACFYDEKVDVTVDGVPQERPRTHFS